MVRRFELKDLHVICTNALFSQVPCSLKSLVPCAKGPNPTGPSTGDQYSCIGLPDRCLMELKAVRKKRKSGGLIELAIPLQRSSFLLEPVNDDNKMVFSRFLIFGLLALQRIGRHQVAYSESPGTQRVVSHEWSTAWDPSESNLSLLRLSHLACPAAAYGFNLVPQQSCIRDFRSDRPCKHQ
jgi:hypothetical protein